MLGAVVEPARQPGIALFEGRGDAPEIDRLGTFRTPAHGALRGRQRSVALEAAPVAAGAGLAAGNADEMGDLARHAIGAAIGAPARHDPPTEPGPHVEVEKVAPPAARTVEQ